jgi:hypothetical protein
MTHFQHRWLVIVAALPVFLFLVAAIMLLLIATHPSTGAVDLPVFVLRAIIGLGLGVAVAVALFTSVCTLASTGALRLAKFVIVATLAFALVSLPLSWWIVRRMPLQGLIPNVPKALQATPVGVGLCL